MNPEWPLRYRATIITRLEMNGFSQLIAEEAVDKSLEEIENKGYVFNNKTHFQCVWYQRAYLRALDLARIARRRPRTKLAPLDVHWRWIFNECLNQLCEVHRSILEWSILERLTDREIGQRLFPDLPLGNAARKAREERLIAQSRLREILLRAGLDAETFDFDFGPFARLRRRRPKDP